MNLFQITKSEIDIIFQIYQERTRREEIDFIQTEHEGIQGLAKKEIKQWFKKWNIIKWIFKSSS